MNLVIGHTARSNSFGIRGIQTINNKYAFSFANIPVTYIEQPIQQMGEKAIDLLIEQLQGNNQIKQLILNSDIKFTI